MQSALYRGVVVHRRHAPRRRGFRFRLSMLYLDLDELPRVFAGRWLWSLERRNVASFRRSDHLGPAHVPLADAARDRVEASTGERPAGPVRLLTHLRYLGLCFNPASFYYCFDADGETLRAVVVEVHNTPWGERHSYVIPAGERPRADAALRHEAAKRMHVSPFLGMEQRYRFRIAAPGARLRLAITNCEAGRPVFGAGLDLERREIGARSLAAHLLTHPWMTGEVLAGIYWQAFRLWLEGTPYHPHPARRAEPEEARA